MGSAILAARIARFVALTAISEDLNMCEATVLWVKTCRDSCSATLPHSCAMRKCSEPRIALAHRVEMMLKTGRKNHPRNFRGGAHHVIPKVMTLKWEDHMHRMIMNMESHKNTLFADTFPSERFLANLLPSLQWKLEADWLQDLHFGMSLE